MSSNNTYFSLATLKASSVAEGTAFLAQVPAVEDGAFFWTPGNFTGQADDINIIKADGSALSVGAWVRQGAQSVSLKRPETGAKIRSQEDKSSEIISMDDFAGADPTLASNSIAALQSAIDACPVGGTINLPTRGRISASGGTTAITINKTMTFAGPGRRTGNISDGNLSTGLLYFDSDVAVAIEIDNCVVTFDGVAIIGVGVGTATGDGIHCHGDSSAINLVGGSVVQGFKRGIVANAGDYCKIERSSVVYCETGIQADGCYNFNIIDSHVRSEGAGSRGIVGLNNSQINVFGGALESFQEYGALLLSGASLNLSGVYIEGGDADAVNIILGDGCSLTERAGYIYMSTCSKHITVEGSGTTGFRIDSCGNIFVPETSSRRVDYYNFNQAQSTGQVIIDGHRFATGLIPGANNNWLNPNYLADYAGFAQGVGYYRVNFPLSHASFNKGYSTVLDVVDPAVASLGSVKNLTAAGFKAADAASDPIGIRSAYGPNAPYRAVYQNEQWEKVGLRLANQADSTAVNVAGIVADFNAFLAKVRAAGVMP